MLVIIRYEHTANMALLNKLVSVLDFDQVEIASSNYCGPLPGDHRPARRAKNFFGKAIIYVFNQLKISKYLLSNRKRIESVVYFTGGSALVLPAITGKLIGKRTVLIATGSAARSYRTLGTLKFGIESRIISVLENFNYSLCDVLVVESPAMKKYLDVTKFEAKTIVASLAIEESFKKIEPYHQRKKRIGYVGRLNKEKGVMNLIEALPSLSEMGYEFVIVGDGVERARIEEFLQANDLTSMVKMMGIIDRKEMVAVMNSFRLLILPSFTEGLPNVVMEAMACGTPVLANSVGGIPDIIQDGVNGYLMNDNFPSTIAMKVRQVISENGLEMISNTAERSIRAKFSPPVVREQWKEAFNKKG